MSDERTGPGSWGGEYWEEMVLANGRVRQMGEENRRLYDELNAVRADLACALPVVEAAEALAAHESKHWVIDGDDAAEQARLVLAVGTAVRKAKGK